jgi:hypothetical protein
VRWADVETVTTVYYEGEETGVSLRTSPRYLPVPWPTFSEQASKG